MWRATQSYFIGEWQMVRIVEDVGHGVIGEVWGEADYTPDGTGLVCVERGVMRFGGEDTLTLRTSLWRFDEDGRIAVQYEDGRPFHDFLTEQPIALFLEGDAEYRIEYEFDVESWLSIWEMAGGKNDYRMITRYRRPGLEAFPAIDPFEEPEPFDPLKGE